MTAPQTPATAEGGWTAGDIVQVTDDGHHWFAALIVITEVKSWGVQGYAPVPANDGSGTGSAFIRLNDGTFEKVGSAVLVRG